MANVILLKVSTTNFDSALTEVLIVSMKHIVIIAISQAGFNPSVLAACCFKLSLPYKCYCFT